MDGCEKFAGERGFKTIYLSTHDQEGFYNRLGFQLCEPICFYGGSTKMVKVGGRNFGYSHIMTKIYKPDRKFQ